jgi:hypothetical protein
MRPDGIVLSEAFPEDCCQPAEDVIPGLMAVGVVDLFEMVDIAHPHGQQFSVPPGVGEFFVKMVQDGAAIEHARQRIPGGLIGQGLAAGNERGLHLDHPAADLDPGPEFAGVKGLAQVIVGTGVQPGDDVGLFPLAVSMIR